MSQSKTKIKTPFPPPIYADGRKVMWVGGNGVTFRQNKVLIAQVRQTDHGNEAEDMAAALAHRYNCHEQMVEAVAEAKLQIEYLHGKFQATGTGNAVLAKLQAAIEAAEGE